MTERISSVEDLLEKLKAVNSDGREYWYRGHRDSEWLLQPSAFRTSGHRNSEQAMLDRFRQEAAVAGQSYSFDDWGWITFAQHHELPTRLLDWSQSPLVGLFFACERSREHEADQPEADGELLMIDPRDLNTEAGDAGGGHPALLRVGHAALDSYLPGKDSGQRLKPRAVIAPMSFDRIRFQSGTFTVSQSPQEGILEPQLASAKSLVRFLIPSSSKQDLRMQLETLGLTEVTIYRDLDRIATRIKATHKVSM